MHQLTTNRSVKLTTAAPQAQSYEGTLFTACPVLNVAILNTRTPQSTAAVDASTQPGDYRIIPFSRIQSFQVVSLAEDSEGTFASALPSIGPVDTRRLKEREAAKMNKMKEEERNRGKGVTKEAQAIFDSFKRMYVDNETRFPTQHPDA